MFSAYFNHSAQGAVPHANIDTVEDCANLCSSKPECIAFDFDENDPPYQNCHCWIHDNPNIEIKDHTGVTHYPRGTCPDQSNYIILLLFYSTQCHKSIWMKDNRMIIVYNGMCVCVF